VKAGAVAVREAGPGDKRLIAYVVRAPGRACTSEELRAYLKQKLPDYMVPSSVHFLASLPLNGNGKVDRKILPAAGDCEHTPLHAEDGAPAAIDAVQFRLAKIWEKLLGIEQVDVRENFFDLGGHSLMAARLVAEIDRTFGKTLPVALLFEYPTIKQLAALLVRDEPIAIPRVIAVQSAGCKPPFFCVHAEALFRPLARSLGFDRPLLGLRADTEAWPVPYRLKDIVTAHVSAIRAVQPEGPYFLGGFCFDGIIAYEIAQRLRAEGQRVALLVLFDAPNPARGRGPQPGLARKVSFHFDNLRRLGPGKEALQYIGKRITTRVSTRLWEASYWFHVRAGLRVDGRLRDRQEIVYNVCRAHVPQPYPGRVVLFRSEPRVIDSDATPELGWGD
jgi:aspartate racemase